MLLAIRDDSDDSLRGAINGINATFKTSLPMRLDRIVEVLSNGRLLEQDFDNGYDIIDAYTIKLREIPLDGDTVMVRYFSEPQSPGVVNSQPVGVRTQTLQPGSIEALCPRPEISIQTAKPDLVLEIKMG